MNILKILISDLILIKNGDSNTLNGDGVIGLMESPAMVSIEMSHCNPDELILYRVGLDPI